MQIAFDIRDAGGEAISVPGDVTAEDFAPKIIKATIDKYGALHILVNNAGDSLVSYVCKALQGVQAQSSPGLACTYQSALPQS